jgi:signal recognition particle receptor subunit beta
VLDAVDRQRLFEVNEEIEKLLSSEILSKCPILVFANKSDLEYAMTISEVAYELKINEWKNRIYHVQLLCAVTGDGLMDGLEWLSNQLQN